MNPRPAVMLRVKSDDWPIERYAPPMAASAPEMSTPEYLTRATLTPAVSAASGFSPTARRRNPYGVRFKTYQVRGTSAKAKMMGAVGRRLLIGICGVAPVESKSAPLISAGTPRKRMLIAVPVTTWSALYLMQARA